MEDPKYQMEQRNGWDPGATHFKVCQQIEVVIKKHYFYINFKSVPRMFTIKNADHFYYDELSVNQRCDDNSNLS